VRRQFELSDDLAAGLAGASIEDYTGRPEDPAGQRIAANS